MRKIITVAILFILFIPILKAETIEKEYYFDEYSIISQGEYQTIIFPNTKTIGKSGEPALPYHAVSLLLPPGDKAADIKIIKEDKITLAGKYILQPYQPSRPISSGKADRFYKNEDLYKSNMAYPKKCNTKISSEIMSGYSFALSTFTPVEYNPAKGEVSYYKKVTVEIETVAFEKGAVVLNNISSKPVVLNRIKKFAQNESQIANYPAKKLDRDSYQMLIITPENYTGYFEELSFNYLCQGIICEIETTEDIESEMSGQDLPEKIRNYIIQEYQQNSIEYVLLGGDAELVPPRFFYCTALSGGYTYETNNIAADIYYSALDGTWNDDGDEYWGEEGEDDLLPEISVARLPFSGNHDLSNMLHKTLSYQNNPVLGELTKSILAGEHLWSNPVTWGGDFLDLLIGYHEDNGYTTTGIPEDHDINYLYERDANWSAEDLLAEINGGINFLHHSGHSNSSFNMKLYNNDITNSNFSSVDGVTHNYPVIYTHGCLAGMFGETDCIAEEMLKLEKFAVAGAFNSHYGWFNEGQTEGPSTHLQREFVDALYTDKLNRIGSAHLESKIQTAPWVTAPDQHEEGAQRWCHYDCNILGDPALPLWTDEPLDIAVVYPDSIQLDASNLTVTVYSQGEPLENMTCVLIKDSVLYGLGITNSSGEATINILSLNSTGEAEIYISGYNCLPAAYSVQITNQLGFDDSLVLSESTELIGNYPNPFNPETKIIFNIKRSQKINLTIYNLNGQKIKTLVNKHLPAGQYKEIWDGNNDNGVKAPSGIYFYKLTTPEFSKTGKAVFMK